MLQLGKRFVILSKKVAKYNHLTVALEQNFSNKIVANETSASLTTEVGSIDSQKIIKKEHIEGNADLLKTVELAKQQLINLDTLKGTTRNVQNYQSDVDNDNKPEIAKSNETATLIQEKKLKKNRQVVIDFGRLDLRVGKITEVSKHPFDNSLYLAKVDCGEPKPRSLVAGLVKFVPIEDIKDRMVIVMCNLKPAEMRGVVSEAMVMCASTEEKVEILSPPLEAVPGDLVHCEGFIRGPDDELSPKKKAFLTCLLDLTTNDSLQACYKGTLWNIPGKGFIVSHTLKNVNIK